ncbi:chromo domain-containing protein [Apiospora arundinis]
MSQHALHGSDGPSPSQLRRYSTYFPDHDTRRYSTYFPDQDSPTIGRVQQVNLVLPDPLALDLDSHSPLVSPLGTK